MPRGLLYRGRVEGKRHVHLLQARAAVFLARYGLPRVKRCPGQAERQVNKNGAAAPGTRKSCEPSRDRSVSRHRAGRKARPVRGERLERQPWPVPRRRRGSVGGARRGTDYREKPETLHEGCNRTDVTVASGIINQGRPEDRPGDPPVLTERLDFLLGPPQGLCQIPLVRIGTCALKNTLDVLRAINRFPPAMRAMRAGNAETGASENKVAWAGMLKIFPLDRVSQENSGGVS